MKQTKKSSAFFLFGKSKLIKVGIFTLALGMTIFNTTAQTSGSTIKLSNISVDKTDAQVIYQTTKQVYSFYLNISEPANIDTLQVLAGSSIDGSEQGVFKFILKQRASNYFLINVSDPTNEYFFNNKEILLTLFLGEPLPAYITAFTIDKSGLESNRVSTTIK